MALRAAPSVVSGLLVLALARELVHLTVVFSGAVGETTVAGSAPSPTPPESPVSFDLDRIVNAHLFGVASAEPNPADANAAPQTQTNLILTGTMASADPRKGYAIVGESTATAKTYPTGAALRPGTTLHSVYRDRVILDSGGRLETVALYRANTKDVIMGRPSPTANDERYGATEQLSLDMAQLSMSEPVDVPMEVAASYGRVLKEAQFVQSPEPQAVGPVDEPTVFELPPAMQPEAE